MPHPILALSWDFNKPNLLHSEIVKTIEDKTFYFCKSERERIGYLSPCLYEAKTIGLNVRNSINWSGIIPRIMLAFFLSNPHTPHPLDQANFHYNTVLKSMGQEVI